LPTGFSRGPHQPVKSTLHEFQRELQNFYFKTADLSEIHGLKIRDFLSFHTGAIYVYASGSNREKQ
jgi:hypothetical protein